MRLHTYVRTLLVLAGLAMQPVFAHADFGSSSAWFDSLTQDDRTLLQSRLILTGHYAALADGEFGQQTYRAITGFQRLVGEPQSGVLSTAAIERLNGSAAAIFEALGMDFVAEPRSQITLIVPRILLPREEDTRRGKAYFDPTDNIRLETIRKPLTEQSFEDLYVSLAVENPTRRVSYGVLRPDHFAVSGVRDGRYFYIFFQRTATDSIGYSVDWSEQEREHGSMLAVFLASYSYPTAYDQDVGTEDFETIKTPDSAPDKVPAGPAPGQMASGSGFFVSEEGLIVTNQHVVDGCNALTVPGYGAVQLITSDKTADLALLKTISATPKAWAVIRPTAVELGENVIMLGYPLSDLLNSSLSVGTGIVSSETGIGGEAAWFTSNVGVQPGNSGGPIVDSNGQVVGVAVGKFDDQVMMAASGNVAPNFGFAIKNTELLKFLSIFRTSVGEPPNVKKSPSVQDIVRSARDYTVQVLCKY